MAKYSLRAHIVRFAPESGLKSDIAGGPFRATEHRELVQRILTASPSQSFAMGLDFLTYRGQSCLKGSEFV